MTKRLELKPEDLPMTIRLDLPGDQKEYVLLKTKQDKLLLNKQTPASADRNS